MLGIKEIQTAIDRLTPEELSQLRRWFFEHDAALWDCEMEEDIKKGRLDFLAEEALEEHKKGKTRKF